MDEYLKSLENSSWSGAGELWLDPLGDEVTTYDCSLEITANKISYNWVYKSEQKQGCFSFNDAEITWSDSWHQPETVTCNTVDNPRGLFTVDYSYVEEGEESWGWRMQLSRRPDNSLVLQMTNIAPWGEETRAVRMVFVKL